MRVAGIAWVATLGLALGMAVACGSSSEGRGRGVVQDVDAQARRITLDHGDIPGLMKAMTMTFEVAPGVALEGLDAGAKVDFRVQEEDGGVYTVTELRRSGP
jgi:Cu/Ag efflux protein CusF